MNKGEQRIAKLEEQLGVADELKQVLRVHFFDGEVWDLSGFSIGQDQDEQWPHCYTTVVQAVNVSGKKRKCFPPHAPMMFHLNDVKKTQKPPV